MVYTFLDWLQRIYFGTIKISNNLFLITFTILIIYSLIEIWIKNTFLAKERLHNAIAYHFRVPRVIEW